MIITDKLISKTLDNGLNVFLIQDPTATLVSAKVYVRAGAINEDPCLGYGISHFLEHLLAGGATQKHPESYYQEKISLMGGAYNAYTSADHTCYFLNTVPEFAGQAIEILYEWMFLKSFTDKEFKREQSVITREIERDQVNVQRQFYRSIQESFFSHHPSRYPILGYLEDFKKVSIPQLEAYYKKYYVPANMVLVIGGNLSEKDVMSQVQKTFGAQPFLSPPPTCYSEEPLPFCAQTLERSGKVSVTYLAMRFPSIGIMHPDLYAVDLLDYILGNGESSELFSKVVEKKKLAYSISSSSYTPTHGGGYFEIIAQIDAKNVEAVEAEIKAVIEKLKTTKITPKKLSQAKKQKRAEDILGIDSIEDKVDRVGQGMIFANTPDLYTEYAKNFSEVTAEQVQAAAQKYLDFSKSLTLRYYPEDETKKTGATKKSAQKIEAIPQKTVLSNGIRVLLYPDSSRQGVQGKLYLLGGLRAENPQNNGIGYLVSQVLGKKSKHYSKQKVQDIIEGNGAAMAAGLGYNSFTFGIECLSEDLPPILELWADALINPIFDQSEIDQARRRQLKSITQRKDDWYSLSNYQFRQEFFKDHPYGLSLIGEKSVVESLTQDDLNRYHQATLNPKNMVISLFGDIQDKSILDTLEKLYGGIATPKTKLGLPVQNRPLLTDGLTKVKTIPQDVAAVYLAFDGLTFQDESDALAFEMVSALLCGANYPSGRFHLGLREQGLVYQVHGSHQRGIESGVLFFCALTHKAGIEKVKTFMMDQIESLAKGPVSQTEFDQALAQLRFAFQERLATWDGLATTVATHELFGLGFDAYIEQRKRIDLLTPNDTYEAAKRYLKHPQLYIFERK